MWVGGHCILALLHQIKIMHINPWFWRFSLFCYEPVQHIYFFAELLYSIVYGARWVSIGLNLCAGCKFGDQLYPLQSREWSSIHLTNNRGTSLPVSNLKVCICLLFLLFWSLLIYQYRSNRAGCDIFSCKKYFHLM